MWLAPKLWTLFEVALKARFTADEELRTERALRQAAERELAAKQATIEWLSTWVNQLQHERAQIVDRVLGVSLPPLEINIRPPDAPAPGQTLPTPLQVAQRMPVQTAPVPDVPAKGDERAALAAYESSGAFFDDMGDEAARAAGLPTRPAFDAGV